jgi:hypothetical protein
MHLLGKPSSQVFKPTAEGVARNVHTSRAAATKHCEGLMRYIAAILAFLSTPASACAIPASELSIGGVDAGATEASVLEHLGVPDKIIDNGEGTELHFAGLVVTVGWLEQAAPGIERHVLAIRGDAATDCTPKGLCPGMPAAVAESLYGKVEPTVRDTGTYFEYQPTEANCWLQVSVTDGKVESLAVACQP